MLTPEAFEPSSLVYHWILNTLRNTGGLHDLFLVFFIASHHLQPYHIYIMHSRQVGALSVGHAAESWSDVYFDIPLRLHLPLASTTTTISSDLTPKAHHYFDFSGVMAKVGLTNRSLL